EDPIVSDPMRLGQVLDNLVENAVKYSDPRKLAPVVRVETKALSGRLYLRVVDNGIGIPADRHADVFKMFKRFGYHDQVGSGLGLALVRKHVERLGGEIRFTSSPDGTSFEVELPLPGPGERGVSE